MEGSVSSFMRKKTLQSTQNVSIKVVGMTQDLLETLMSLICFMLVCFMRSLIQACCN